MTLMTLFIIGMYRTLQLFVLALKIDIFIEFLVSVFYLIQFALKDKFSSWFSYVFVIITILMLPMFLFGRAAVSTDRKKKKNSPNMHSFVSQAASESPVKMIVFIVFQLLVVFQLVLIAKGAIQPGEYWYTWICFGKVAEYNLFYSN